MFQYGDIILHDKYEYVVFGTSREIATERGIKNGDMHAIGTGIYAIPYDDSDDYYIVRFIYKYLDKYYYIPNKYSSVSMEGSIAIETKGLKKIGYISLLNTVKELDIEICVKICPGYLDIIPDKYK